MRFFLAKNCTKRASICNVDKIQSKYNTFFFKTIRAKLQASFPPIKFR